MRAEPLIRNVLTVAPRVLGQLDRSAGSPTFGCCERYYWKYKLHDFPNARFQEMSWLMALLFTTCFEGNVFYGKDILAQWVLAACRFWQSRRNNDGSCQEAYPFERSYCATSFSTWSVCQSLVLLRGTSVRPLVEMLLGTTGFCEDIETTGRWLVRNTNYKVSNQSSAAALSLQSIADLSGNAAFAAAAREIVDQLFLAAGDEGLFPEYEGFDLGYATITLSCLCKYADASKRWGEIGGRLSTICEALSKYIDDNGWFDPAAMSRGTGFLYPYGFARCASPSLTNILNGLQTNSILSPTWMDDRYCIPMAADYAHTLKLLTDGAP